MGKREITIYSCDRCGKEESSGQVACYHFMHILKWWVPKWGKYRLLYLCHDCYKQFDKWVQEGEASHEV